MSAGIYILSPMRRFKFIHKVYFSKIGRIYSEMTRYKMMPIPIPIMKLLLFFLSCMMLDLFYVEMW